MSTVKLRYTLTPRTGDWEVFLYHKTVQVVGGVVEVPVNDNDTLTALLMRGFTVDGDPPFAKISAHGKEEAATRKQARKKKAKKAAKPEETPEAPASQEGDSNAQSTDDVADDSADVPSVENAEAEDNEGVEPEAAAGSADSTETE